MALDMTMTTKATTPTDDGDGTRHGTRNPATLGIVASCVVCGVRFRGCFAFRLCVCRCVCVLWGRWEWDLGLLKYSGFIHLYIKRACCLPF